MTQQNTRRDLLVGTTAVMVSLSGCSALHSDSEDSSDANEYEGTPTDSDDRRTDVTDDEAFSLEDQLPEADSFEDRYQIIQPAQSHPDHPEVARIFQVSTSIDELPEILTITVGNHDSDTEAEQRVTHILEETRSLYDAAERTIFLKEDIEATEIQARTPDDFFTVLTAVDGQFYVVVTAENEESYDPDLLAECATLTL